MSRRFAARAVLTLACACAGAAAVPASASADVGPGGFGISDDLHIPRISLSETFDELEPKSFRLIVSWSALDDPAYVAQVRDRVNEANAAARAPGGMEIAVTFSVPPQTVDGVPLTGEAWIAKVKPFIDSFSADVEWWSPMNEPGLKGWTFTPAGARLLAHFSVRLKSYLEQSHPADRLLSPDFNDHYNADGTIKRHPAGDSFVQRYVMHFANAGGQFGSMIAWHPYGAVRRKSMASTDDLVATLNATSGATLPIWVTEAGAHVNDNYVPGQTEAQQEDQVRWMTDTTSGLASHDRVTRMHYYNVRQEPDTASSTCQPKPGFPWDSGLVRACGDKRPAWYAWCLASRSDTAACYDDGPAAAAWSPTRLDVFWRGNGDDAALYRRSWTGSAWSAVSSFGGTTSSTPAVIAPAANRLEVYRRGADNFTWFRRWDGSSWSNWTSIAGRSYVGPTAAARKGTSIVDVFVRGTDNAVYHRFRNGNTWSSGWSPIGAPPGGATSAPAAISNAPGRIDVFVRGADAAIWQRTWTGSWSAWRSAGGVATSAPAAVSRGANNIILFFRGTDGQIYQRTDNGSGWLDRGSLGGATVSSPGAVAASADRIDVWARGADNALQHKVWKSSTGWAGWSGSWLAGP